MPCGMQWLDDEVQGVAVGPKRLSADLDGTYTGRFFARQISTEGRLKLANWEDSDPHMSPPH